MNLRIEKVAALVGCGKAAIYRRWPTKPELVAAAILDGTVVGTTPDSGDVVEDLLEHAWQHVRNFHPEADRFNHAATQNNGFLLAMFNMDVIPLVSEQYMVHRHAMGEEILARAVSRREIRDDLDHDLIIDTLAGFTLFRMTVKPDVRAQSEESLRGSYRRLIRSLLRMPDDASSPAKDNGST